MSCCFNVRRVYEWLVEIRWFNSYWDAIEIRLQRLIHLLFIASSNPTIWNYQMRHRQSVTKFNWTAKARLSYHWITYLLNFILVIQTNITIGKVMLLSTGKDTSDGYYLQNRGRNKGHLKDSTLSNLEGISPVLILFLSSNHKYAF